MYSIRVLDDSQFAQPIWKVIIADGGFRRCPPITKSQVTNHERFEANLAELAVGILDTREEAELLSHLVSCSTCASELERLASAAKSLLLLVLEVEPPNGFESRFLDHLESCSPDAAAVDAW